MSETYQRAIDERHEIELPSEIVSINWQEFIASPGANVTLDLITRYVAANASVTLKIKGKNGRVLQTINDHLLQNRLTKTLPVPDDAEEQLTVEARLSDYNLMLESEAMTIVPRLVFSNLRWSVDEIRRGDVVDITADVQGAEDGTEILMMIKELDSQGAHRMITRFPVHVQSNRIETSWEFDYPSDVLQIPRDEELDSGYENPEFFVTFFGYEEEIEPVTVRFRDWLELTLLDSAGEPRADVEMVAVFADGHEETVTTDAQGVVRIDDVPPGGVVLREPAEDEDDGSTTGSARERQSETA